MAITAAIKISLTSGEHKTLKIKRFSRRHLIFLLVSSLYPQKQIFFSRFEGARPQCDIKSQRKCVTQQLKKTLSSGPTLLRDIDLL